MRRLLTILAVLATAAVAVVLAGAGGDDTPDGSDYWVELDNAFGLIEGGDLKVAGVRAGVITEMKLDQRTNLARVGIKLNQEGFGDMRKDARCESRPQSLIGEYFIDCLPGTQAEKLPKGTTIPVTQTGSTVAPDLVNTILRRPYRERLSIILGELGAAAAGNGKNLNDAIRRAAPALRETDKVLAVLADENKLLADLVRDADIVVGDLAAERKDIGRFVVEAKETAEISATRKQQIAEGFRKLPAFLERLAPTMNALGRSADAQTPALQDLRASADQLEQFFGRLGPFADASRPATRGLGRAAVASRAALRDARPVVDLLRNFAKATPELGTNLRFILEHLDDREWATDPGDVRSKTQTPGGAPGYTGLEALLQYVFDQALSTNVFDSSQHYLKISVFAGDCAPYQNLETLTPEIEEKCSARIGPNPLGIKANDPTKGPPTAQDRRSPDRAAPTDGAEGRVPAFRAPPTAGAQPAPSTTPARPGAPQIQVPDLPLVPEVPPVKIPPILPGQDASMFLDFLLG